MRSVGVYIPFVIVLNIARLVCGLQCEYKDVVLEGGAVRGRGAGDGDYFTFLGVPYATPPVSNLRFKAPQPPLPWEGVYEANRTVKCAQNGEGEEDCLILNIFTPCSISEPLPVLFYIHGGSFIIGSGPTTGMAPLIKEDIVVVTINYRLGPFGFLCLGTPDAPGNAGLKDQIAALKWVKNNIGKFGGDPNRVTIYGMSAGAGSVEFLVLSDMGKGLFSRAVAESASATAVWATSVDPIGTAAKVGEHLGFDDLTVEGLGESYKDIPADVLSKISIEYYGNSTNGDMGFTACVEKEIADVEAFITDSPHNILHNNAFNKVPIMFFFSTLEGLYLFSEEYYKKNFKERMEANFDEFIPIDLIFDNAEIKHKVAKQIKEFYFGNGTLDNKVIEYLNFMGDYIILHGVLNSAVAHSLNNTVYLMEFSYKGRMGSYEEYYENKTSFAGHGDVIKHAILTKPVTNEEDQLAVDRVARIIGNFVKYGNPTPWKTDLLPVSWPQVSTDNISYFHLNKEVQILTDPYPERKQFWDRLYQKYRRRLVPVGSG